MRGVFDEEELEPARESRDTELTLGTGTLAAIGCGLMLLCAVCFGLGYSVGHRGPVPAAAATPQPATEQEPLQASGGIPKPSATLQTPVAQPATSVDMTATEAAPGTGAASASAGAVANPGTTAASQPEVHAALPATAVTTQGTGNSLAAVVHPVLATTQTQGQQFMVQIAAVSNSGDAEVLANALKKRDYPVVEKREPADNFVHVRIGPFASRQIAEQWRMKLLNDGYNAQVQP